MVITKTTVRERTPKKDQLLGHEQTVWYGFSIDGDLMGKYETYLRDKEKMILIPHVGAVNAASAIALGLVARDDR